MEELTANQAKTQFGDMLLRAQRAPLKISKNGKPVAVVLSIADYQALQAQADSTTADRESDL